MYLEVEHRAIDMQHSCLPEVVAAEKLEHALGKCFPCQILELESQTHSGPGCIGS